ncbi:thioredoxin reductase (NADPH) [Streptomyces sp. SAI-117]|uniref:NAD(P)/FAD-dependent oxidoreductase n=1 Tax=Streptomyces sp. SAI-117 TaxID=2940546 RepID=UPI002476A393|nr:FAD-dependent oxidoreductase [Streptomyces sp. SAI-117]MDH6573675.1 thioredoxin reductase (NADPH) [Streptomyces sp. SAI-117]
MSDADEYDVAVVGGGLAALSTGLFAAGFGLRTVVVTEIVMGGELINLEEVVHFPGMSDPISGSELASRVEAQALAAGAEFVFDDVTEIAKDGTGFAVRGLETDIRSRTVVAAMGAGRRRLGLDAEGDLEGRGISYCGTCDGPLFKEKSVAVVGDHDFAGREALVVARYASDVTLITRRAEPDLSDATRSAIDESDRIRVLSHAKVETLTNSDGTLGAVQVRDLETDGISGLDVAGLFVNAGLEPRSSLLRGLVDLDPDGFVRVDAGMRTSLDGLLAVGELRSEFVGYAVAAAGDGAAAAGSARRLIRSWP